MCSAQDEETRMLLIGMLNALAALSVRLTGQTLVLCLRDSQGNVAHSYPDESRLTLQAPLGSSCRGKELPPMHCALHEQPDATPQELELALER